jgi:hypothetical protein
MEATYAYDFIERVTMGMKAQTNFRYLNSKHCIQSTLPLVAPLTGTTFPTNIRDAIPHKHKRLQDSNTTKPGPCNEPKQQQKQELSLNGGYMMLGNVFMNNCLRPLNKEIENNN